MPKHKAKMGKNLPAINMKNTTRPGPVISVDKEDDNNFVIYLQKKNDTVIVEMDRDTLELFVHKASEELKK